MWDQPFGSSAFLRDCRRASILKVHVLRDYLLKKNFRIKEERPVRDIGQISVFPAQFAACGRTFKADETRP
jgi:hypothetical protein